MNFLLPKSKLTIFVFIAFVLFLAIVIALFVANPSKITDLFRNPDEGQIQTIPDKVNPPAIKSYFNGIVTEVEAKTLQVRKSPEEKIVTVTLAGNSKITKGGEEIQLSQVKVGDRVTLYSNRSAKVEFNKTYIAEWVDVFVPVSEEDFGDNTQ